MRRSAGSDPAGGGSEHVGAWSGGELARKDAVGAGPAPSLAEVVGTTRGLSEDAVLWIAAGLAGALAVLHRAGRAHGDVRAGNVLLTRGGPRLTGDAPGRGGGASVPAADMVALGMLLVAAYTGVSNRRPNLDNLPVRLRQVVAVCLAEDPEERATPAQLLAMIRALEPEVPVWTVEVGDLITPADGPVDAAPPSDTPVEAPPRPEPHGLSGARLALVVVAAVLVGVVVTALLLLVPGRDGGTRTADAPVTSRPTRLQPTEDDTPQQRTTPQQEPSEEQTPSTDPATQPARHTSQAPPAPTPQRTRQTGTINDCSGKPLTEPVSLLLFCGDGKATLHDLIWTDWGSATATAQGVVSEVVCQPSCADGREVTSAATVVVSGLTSGRYTLMEIRAPQSPTGPDAQYTLDRLGPTYRG
ncbi:LigA protein [Streptomyces himastatinicus ATCC 53653]|uniref:LigA protein n=1 Tax=Streptomyces himastatinicus ATCC 53653 TaxID=457427 RepID=D9WH50_9ACTN|nr:LigA protein [Streptomyces himastatinicus ATCC 53653]